MEPKLLVIVGSQEGHCFSVPGARFSIGRDPLNHFSISDNSVSREHCIIERQGDDFVIRDLGSQNGTVVNGLRVTDQRLSHRDFIAVGRTVLQFLTRDDIVYEDSAGVSTISVSGGGDLSLTAKLAAADMQALLKISTMLHSFHAVYRGRGSSAKSLLEQHLLSLILDVIPAHQGAILLYEDNFDEPSSLSVRENDSEKDKPVTINRSLVKRVLNEGNGLLVTEEQRSTQVLAAPMVIRKESCGVIYLQGVGFTETHLQLLIAIAQIASTAMENAFHTEWLEAENLRLEADLHPDHHMIGDSPLLRELQRSIARAAQTASTVLILGETGTGKELVARAIHQSGPRAGKPFVAVNCAALTETLLESELFGHEKGAFTGAIAQKKGRLEMAAGGTVFLDEIGEVSPQLQVKLLRVLQERQVERVGGTQPVKLNMRVIAATNRNLEEEVRSGRFRQDFYFRLNVVTLRTPALRERPTDILPLAMHFAAGFGDQCGRRMAGISPEAQAYLTHYDWPGNIRELENAMERAVVLGTGPMIQLEDLPESVREISKPAAVGRSLPLQEAVDEAKRLAIARAFEQGKNDHAAAAQILGVHPNYLYRLMRNLGLR